ncbi:MAG: TetR family transcriptional regulator [Woeseiaceae bacterium]|nr:TetR family transcriptional regulator [Woeseiaceae bacterium]
MPRNAETSAVAADATSGIKSMPRNAEATRERILDAAEKLFAQRGFDGVTVRQIMSGAGADVALAYYHFKSKRDLFDAVLLRRAKTLNELRFAALEEVEKHHPSDPPAVVEIIEAFTGPLLKVLDKGTGRMARLHGARRANQQFSRNGAAR